MARYIDLDKAIERLKASPAFPNMDTDGYFLLGVVEDLLRNQPTADVVPKSEVDKTIAEWAYLHADTLNKLENARAEVAREIFEKIEILLSLNSLQGDVFVGKYFDVDLENDIAELKKKYPEGNNDEM